jgi:hypothetical protein
MLGGQIIDVGNQGFSCKRVQQQRSGFHLRGWRQGRFTQSYFNLNAGRFFREEDRGVGHISDVLPGAVMPVEILREGMVNVQFM